MNNSKNITSKIHNHFNRSKRCIVYELLETDMHVKLEIEMHVYIILTYLLQSETYTDSGQLPFYTNKHKLRIMITVLQHLKRFHSQKGAFETNCPPNNAHDRV